MKIKTSELTGAALDWAVAKCEGGYDLQLRSTYGSKTAWQYTMMDEDEPERMDKFYLADTSYSTDWQLGGPIIDRGGIDLYCNVPTNMAHDDPAWRGSWRAKYHRCGFGTEMSYGPTALIAAMRCYVSSRLGEEVDVPEELL